MAHSTITLIIIAATCVLYIIDKLPVALVTVLGMLAIIFSGATTSRTAFSNFGSTPVLLTFGMIVIINAIVDSGAVVQFKHVLRRMTWRGEKLFLVLVFLLAGWLISMFMSNGSLVSMLASIAVPMAVEYGINPIPIAIACVIGSNLAMATPVATTTITMVQVAGYRFKDYFRLGGLVGVIGVITAWTAIVMLYGL